MTQGTLRGMSELFYQTDPEDISDAEFEKVVLPYMRDQRAKLLITEAQGKSAPRTKRIDAPAGLTLDDLKL